MLTSYLKKLTLWLTNNWKDIVFFLIILLITSFLAYKNYTPNTFLTGWDNLHPEFNFELNLKRSLSAVWQEYQGLGLLGGMAHASDFPRQIILWLVSFVLPIKLIRYFWTFAMLFVGPLGVYFFFKDKSKVGGLVAAVFYIFNLATVQTFFTPFETFVSFFGFLPWLIYFAYTYLKTGKKLIYYCLISILATCAFYVQTLFLVYGIFLLFLSFINFKRSIKLFLITFVINAFWLLPVIYFTLVSGNIPANSKINSIATPETKYMNLARSDFKSIVTFKGYWFDYYDWDQNNEKFDYLYKDWISYSNQSLVEYAGIALFAISIVGLVLSKQFVWLSLLAVSYLMLSGVKIPISILSEAFRNSFTKWSVALSFIVSIGLGYFVSKFKKITLYLFALVLILFSVYQVLPVFKGKLISETMRIDIPSEYFQSFDFLNNRTNGGRVAILPTHNFWGWQFHSWGYRGSGFYWYGVKNPILDRAFDVWSKYNENFYEELNYALLQNKADSLQKVLEKYKVSYIYYDGNLFNPGLNTSSQYDFSKLKLIAQFGNIKIYEAGVFGTDIEPLQTNYPDSLYKAYYKLNSDEIPTTKPFIKETFSENQGYKNPYNCDLNKNGNVAAEKRSDGNFYSAYDGGISCDYFYYPTINNLDRFILRVKGENILGRSLKIYLNNVKTQKTIIEDLLPTESFDQYYLVNPIYFDQKDASLPSGYTLNVETRSFGKIASENLLSAIEIYPVDIPLQDLIPQSIDNNLQISDVKKYGTWAYKVDIKGNGLMQLNQGYEKGWLGVSDNHLLEHKKINGWANGWTVQDSPIAYLIFWPQLLEFVGFGLLIISFVVLLTVRKKTIY